MKPDVKIPTIVALLLIFGLGASLMLFRRTNVYVSNASTDTVPTGVSVTNNTDKSFTVSWTTSKPAVGYVQVNSQSSQKTFFDVRDNGQPGTYLTHYVEVGGLQPDLNYSFNIYSQGKKYPDNGETPYATKTAKQFTGELPSTNIASGSIHTSSGVADGAIVYINIPGVAPLSSITSKQGTWVISLFKAYDSGLTSLVGTKRSGDVVEIKVYGNDGSSAKAIVFADNDDPVPNIILGNEYDFTKESVAPLPTSSSGQVDNSASFSVSDSVSRQSNFSVISPQNGENVFTDKPEIFGNAPQGSKIEITLESDLKFNAELTVLDNNNWRWSPPQGLEPGEHTLTVKFTNPDTGIVDTVIRHFVIPVEAAVNDNPSFTASNSGQISSPTPTRYLVLTPTGLITSTPAVVTPTTITNTPAQTVTITTNSPTATVLPSSMPATSSGIPKTGFGQITFIVILVSLVLLLLGLLTYAKELSP